MAIELSKIFSDHRIDFSTNHSETTSNYIAFVCPWCGSTEMKGGYNMETGHITCWRCSCPKGLTATLMKILRKDYDYVKRLIKKNHIVGTEYVKGNSTPNNKELFLPDHHNGLLNSHKKYIINRGLDWRDINKRYGVVSATKTSGYRDMLLIPIYKDRQLISFLSRATKEAKLRVKNCPTEDEILNYKKSLYGIDMVESDTVFLFEGPWEVYKFGSNTVASYGTVVSQEQIHQLKRFKNVIICFDPGIYSQEAAMNVAASIGVFTNAFVIDVCDGSKAEDPAELSYEEADSRKEEILKQVRSENEENCTI